MTSEEITMRAENFVTDGRLIQDAISEKMGICSFFLVTCIGGFGVSFYLMWKIGLAALGFVTVMFSSLVFTGSLVNNQKYYGCRWSIVEQSIDNAKAVFSYGYEKTITDSFAESMPVNHKFQLVKGLLPGMSAAFNFFAFSLFLWYAGVLIRNSETNGGKAISAIMVAFEASCSLVHAVSITMAFNKGMGSLKVILNTVNEMHSAVPVGELTKPLQIIGGLEVQKISFNYRSRSNNILLFRDLSFSIPSGQIVALVGHRGSGKSTVVSLIQRFYNPLEGQILLDGVNINTLDLSWYRDQIGLLNEDPLIFETSILENIRIGKLDATKEEVEAAAKEANAHTFIIGLPNAYETHVGRCSMQLSESQKHRIVIARTILKNPKIVLLDEPTCGLNVGSERIVQGALEKLIQNRSTLIIAQRLSTIENAFSIFVLQDGHVIEANTHKRLTKKDEFGPYSVLARINEMAVASDGTLLGRTKRETAIVSQKELQGFSGDVDEATETADRHMEAGAERPKLDWQTFKVVSLRLANMSMPFWPCICLGTLGAILCGALLNPIYGYVLGKSFQVYNEQDNNKMKIEVQKYALIYVGAGIVGIGMQVMQSYYFGITGEMVSARVKEIIFEGTLKHEVGWFDIPGNSGKKLKDKMVAAENALNMIFNHSLPVILRSLACFMTAYVIGFSINLQFTLIALVAFPLLISSAMVQELFNVGFEVAIDRAYPQLTTVIEDLLRQLKSVNACNGIEKAVALYNSMLSQQAKHTLFQGNCYSLLLGISNMVVYCTYALLFWYGSRLIVNDKSSFGSIIVLFMVFLTSASEIGAITGAIIQAINSFITLSSISDLTEREILMDPNSSSPETVENVTGIVDFVDVDFVYPSRPDVPILKGLNLKIDARRSIAIVGAMGSGKSAIIALIERFYDPNRGRVMIDGKDIQTLDLHSLRKHIALVQSEPVLFNTSIYENIVCGRQVGGLAEVEEAARAAEAHIFIQALQNGYMTQVNAELQLNMGQRQRIAIARAKLRNAPILLVDDATSGLEADQQKVVQEAINCLMLDRTAIMVTHNLIDVCVVVDEICVLERGRITEQGSHSNLMEANGSYAQLFNIQRIRERQLEAEKRKEKRMYSDEPGGSRR
ncbi:hypothetical protein KP509_02G084300 [Ceratopteris richardii]|nr:hypothetical protein KP509_02G084300 [Ceratopteris richardii]